MQLFNLEDSVNPALSQWQRWAHYLTIISIVAGILVAFNLKERALNTVVNYEDTQAGISAQYPDGWLLDTSDEYVFRVQDTTQPGFKTIIEVSVRPVSSETTERNVLDSLSLNRSQTFTAYNILVYEPFMLPDEVLATAMSYTYVIQESSPFLEGIPTSVQGLDILTLRGGQAIIISFRADTRVFESEYVRFEHFIETLEF